MDKEKEICDMAQKIYERGVALSPLDFVYGAHGDDHFTRIAKYLIDAGYGNVKQAVKEFAEKLKAKLVYVPMSVEVAIDHVLTELYGADE